MCVVCGCAAPAHHGESIAVAPNGDLHFGAGEARVSVPGMSTARAIRLEADVLGANQRIADRNRTHFAAHGITALNLVSSPGSGKTTLLCATIDALKRRAPERPLAVIEGDQQTSHDADRIRATGAPAIQVNTGAEPQKAGVLPEETDAFVASCRAMSLPIIGLMCIPPEGEDSTPHFRQLAEMAKRNGLSNLSMGMSSDFEVAIAHGATHVRVGSAIFGARDYAARG